ncbi:MAG: glutamate--cysteine ligase [Frankia sp.]
MNGRDGDGEALVGGIRTVGIEEEFLLVDPKTGVPTPPGRNVAAAVTRRIELSGSTSGEAEHELTREQLETATAPCAKIADLRAELGALRRAAARSANEAGLSLAATGTSPQPATPSLTPTVRYRTMRDEYGLLAREQLTCGCHVHVAVASDDEAVGVLDRIRVRLGPLIALTANSPFWQAQDTDYASYRTQVWNRWPSAGSVGLFGSIEGYRACVEGLLETGAILDEGMAYFDARLSSRYPTVEVRVADVCLNADDAVLLAALARALVTTAAEEWANGEPVPRVRTESIRLAHWRAARSGLSGELVDLEAGKAMPARVVIERLVEYLRPALERSGDATEVGILLERLYERGTGAERQRAAFARRGRLSDVMDLLARETVPGG